MEHPFCVVGRKCEGSFESESSMGTSVIVLQFSDSFGSFFFTHDLRLTRYAIIFTSQVWKLNFEQQDCLEQIVKSE